MSPVLTRCRGLCTLLLVLCVSQHHAGGCDLSISSSSPSVDNMYDGDITSWEPGLVSTDYTLDVGQPANITAILIAYDSTVSTLSTIDVSSSVDGITFDRAISALVSDTDVTEELTNTTFALTIPRGRFLRLGFLVDSRIAEVQVVGCSLLPSTTFTEHITTWLSPADGLTAPISGNLNFMFTLPENAMPGSVTIIIKSSTRSLVPDPSAPYRLTLNDTFTSANKMYEVLIVSLEDIELSLNASDPYHSIASIYSVNEVRNLVQGASYDLSLEYRDAAQNAYALSGPKRITIAAKCSDNEYTSDQGTDLVAHTCTSLTVCGDDETESQGATSTTDRVCVAENSDSNDSILFGFDWKMLAIIGAGTLVFLLLILVCCCALRKNRSSVRPDVVNPRADTGHVLYVNKDDRASTFHYENPLRDQLNVSMDIDDSETRDDFQDPPVLASRQRVLTLAASEYEGETTTDDAFSRPGSSLRASTSVSSNLKIDTTIEGNELHKMKKNDTKTDEKPPKLISEEADTLEPLSSPSSLDGIKIGGGTSHLLYSGSSKNPLIPRSVSTASFRSVESDFDEIKSVESLKHISKSRPKRSPRHRLPSRAASRASLRSSSDGQSDEFLFQSQPVEFKTIAVTKI